MDTRLFDSQESRTEWDRQTSVSTLCNGSQPENWEDLLVTSDQTFVRDLIVYGRENLIKVHMFLSSPFATHYERSIETTTISFVANIGGQQIL